MTALRSFLFHPRTVRTAQALMGVLLGWAALAKIGDIPTLANQVHLFRLVPVASENLLAMVLPWIEMVAALSLVLGIRPRAGATVASGMLVVFTVAVGLAMARGLNFECGCFGTSDASRVGMVKLLENFGMIALAVTGTLRPAAAPRETVAAEV